MKNSFVRYNDAFRGSHYFSMCSSNLFRIEQVKNGFSAAQWCIERKRWRNALALLKESSISYLCLISGELSPNCKDDRSTVEFCISKLIGESMDERQWHYHPTNKRDIDAQLRLLQRLSSKGIFHTFAQKLKRLDHLHQVNQEEYVNQLNGHLQSLILDEL